MRTDVILGQTLLKLRIHVGIELRGSQPALTTSTGSIKTDAVPHLFKCSQSDCKLIITKSRKHSVANEKFIAETIRNQLRNGVAALKAPGPCNNWRKPP